MLTHTISFFITLLALANPIGNSAIFVSITQQYTQKELLQIITKTAISSFSIMLLSGLIGMQLLSSMGITIDDFRFAGGLVLIKIGFSMFSGVTDQSSYHGPEHDAELSSLAIVPLTIPLIAGPGVMVAVIQHMHKVGFTLYGVLSTTIAIALVSAVVSICFYATTIKQFHLLLQRKAIVGIINRIFGLLVIAMASSLLLTGLKGYLG